MLGAFKYENLKSKKFKYKVRKFKKKVFLLEPHYRYT